MDGKCEFCETTLARDQPENVALLQHLAKAETCEEQFNFMLENLHASWTLSVSGP